MRRTLWTSHKEVHDPSPSSASSAAAVSTTCRGCTTRAGRRWRARGDSRRTRSCSRRSPGLPVRFLPRHGRGHRLSPSGIDYRANIDAMKRAGVTDLVSISACGSFREELAPGHFVLVDQFIDRTFAREKSFFGNGLVAHVAMGDPVSPRPARAGRGGDDGRRHRAHQGRHVSGDGRPAVLDAGRNRISTASGAAR